MRLLEQRILQDGTVEAGHVLKVDSFLNHQMDVALFAEMGREFFRLFGDCGVTKILTIEASGIGIACIAAEFFRVPVVFAKKSKASNLGDDFYTTQVHSYTRGTDYDIRVGRRYLCPEDRVLLIDDFLANGCALEGLCEIVREAGATLVGAGIAIEKGFQPGGQRLREAGIRVESLAIVDEMDEHGIVFREN